MGASLPVLLLANKLAPWMMYTRYFILRMSQNSMGRYGVSPISPIRNGTGSPGVLSWGHFQDAAIGPHRDRVFVLLR
ncbi:hypothetical protein FA15DRAFT_464029 [Coprinopsis marcescibilis]|uniref:Uncharacterized protein n=1 Tax=Coprinopsis marcescibilis TaxID=230819 RepID=A0A5C3KS90_COPMA|nr:hypothetical protein FA15DRAFT_464029 [Coprinopsis marcescibilis]